MINTLSGILGFASALLSALVLYGTGLNLPALITGINPSLIVLGSAAFLGIWSLSSRGCKHLPYWITLLAGITLVFFSLTPGAKTAGTFFSDDALATTGLAVIIFSRIISTRYTMNARRYYIGGILLTAAAVIGLGALSPSAADSRELSYDEGKEALMALLHPGAENYVEDIDSYVENILEDETLNPSAKEAEILALNRRIAEMEAELQLFEKVKEENEASRQEIIALRKRVDEALSQVAESGGEALKPVSSIAMAVQPDLPMVRDFAAALAAETPGSFYSSVSYGNPTPGEIGVKQIITIQRYISGEWKYVNDPMFAEGDYYSPAGRTLAAGLVGDCDDYAILTASAIEAIGGKTRIMGGTCSEGGHAWPEVYIGNRTAWNKALRVVNSVYPGRSVQYLKDSSGNYWLSLDWQLGSYTCGGNPEILYQSDWR